MLQWIEMQQIWWSATVATMLAGEIGNGGCGEGEHVPLPPWNAVAAAHGKLLCRFTSVPVNFNKTVMGRAWPAVAMSLNLTY